MIVQFRFAIFYPAAFYVLPDEIPQAVFSQEGYTEHEYEIYQTLVNKDGVVFSPRTDSKDIRSPARLSEPLNLHQEKDFDGDALTAIQNWRDTKYPGYLRQAGITFLIFDREWVSWLSTEAYQILTNPDYYEILIDFPPNVSDPYREYMVFRVVGEQISR